MPIDLRKFRQEIENQGYSLAMTAKGHYWVVKPDGGKLVNFAVGHGKNKNLILDSYASKVRKAIADDK